MSEWDKANLFAKWSFSVPNAMIQKGYRQALEFSDLLRLPDDYRSSDLTEFISQTYPVSKAFFIYPKLMMAVFGYSVCRIWVVIFLGCLKGALRIATMVVLRYFLHSLIDPNGGEPFMWVGIIGALNIVTFLTHGCLYYSTMKLGWMWKMSVTGFIYKKLFDLKSSQLYGGTLGSLGTGKLVNLISNDVARFEEFAVFGSFVYVSVLEVIGVLVVLAVVMNWPSAIAGVGTTVIFLPLQIYLGGVFARIRSRTASSTDKRVRFISEVIEGMSTVKCYGWEVPFFATISEARASELASVISSQYIKAVNMGLYCFGPTVATFATFAVYWGTGAELTIPVVFFGISMLLLLRETVGRNFSRGIETTSEVISAVTRVQQFLDIVDDNDNSAEEVQKSVNGSNNNGPSKDDAKIRVHNTSYSYIAIDASNSTTLGACTLKNIDFSVSSGELLMVVGAVGSGKSTLLNALLDELQSHSPESKPGRACRGSIAYCAQRPWIVASTVKSNIILAGQLPAGEEQTNKAESDLMLPDGFKYPRHLDSAMYELALASARINEDIKQWQHGDLTEIGERGISVSGGQKARIALARAVYADADIYLLDDVLSAVDAHVGRAIFSGCILKALRDRGKAVVLATHQVQYLKFASKIIVLDGEGNQAFYGTFDQLRSRASEFSWVGLGPRSRGTSLENVSPDGDSDEEVLDTDEVDLEVTQDSSAPLSTSSSSGIDGTPEIANSSYTSTSIPITNSIEGEQSKENVHGNAAQDKKTLTLDNSLSVKQKGGVQEEKAIQGEVSSKLWLNYLSSGGFWQGVVVMISMIFSQAALMMADYWLKWWAKDRFGDQNKVQYLWIYAILTFLAVLFGVWRALAWFSFTIQASRQLHENSLWALFHTEMSFFVANPSGRILNRFSRDQNLVDEQLPYTLYDCMHNGLLFLLGTIALVCVSIPWLVIMVPFLGWGFNAIRMRYVRSSREVRRIEATLRSPIYSDFSASLEGLVTLRAYRLQQRATSAFLCELDRDSRAWFSFMMVSRWLCFRLDLICLLIILSLCILGAALRHTVDVGLLGFALTYSMAITTLLQWTIRQLAEAENMMTSVERIAEYASLTPEKGYRVTLDDYKAQTDPSHKLGVSRSHEYEPVSSSPGIELKTSLPHSANKQQVGPLELRDLTVAYRRDMDPVLRDLSVTFGGGMKVGICGRTGSGKSSTLLALLRLNVITGGDIVLNGKSLLSMHLEDARGCLSTIPQEPHLFSGTIRFNLDPFNSYSDAQIWSALDDACIRGHIEASSKGLDMMVDEGGKNFSVGQRQLLSLARAVLRRCPVVLMDEVTASIDYETDRMIQRTIRESPAMRDSTIITVAHRLRTIADSDLIIVVQAGQLVESGTPSELLQQPNSIFRALAEESNEMEEITRLAQLGSMKMTKM